MIEIFEVSPGDDRVGEVYPVLNELRDQMSLDQFVARYEEGHRDGYRVLALYDDGECRAVAGYRILTNFVHGRVLYVDDLVTSGAYRSRGYGKMLNDHLRNIASDADCVAVTLDSHTNRLDAHRFYFREGYVITSFHFGRPLK